MIRGTTGAPSALIVFYRAWMLAADTGPVEALATRTRRSRFSSDGCICDQPEGPPPPLCR